MHFSFERFLVFEIPINYKPTFINMDLLDTNIHFVDLIDYSNWNFSVIARVLSNSLDFPIRNFGRIDPYNQNPCIFTTNFQ